VSKVLILFVS